MSNVELNEDQITEYVIDFTELRKNKLDESFLAMFGNITKWILKRMFGEEIHMPVTVRGTESEVHAFANALGKEKKYLDVYKKYGLNDPRTHRSKGTLQKAVGKFTRATGLKWPFK
jgi:hypothetical protein